MISRGYPTACCGEVSFVDEAVAVHIQSRQKRRMTGREAYEANSYLRSRALRDAFCEVSYKIARESIYETSFILQEGGG